MLAERKHGISTQVGLVLRHCPVVWKMKQIIKENVDAFGERLSFIFRDTQNWPIGTGLHESEWRKDPSLAHGGSLFEHSIHDVDVLEYLFGDQASISKMFAKIRYVSPLTQGKLEDVATLNFEYEDGFVGNLLSVWNKAKMDERRGEIFFENGYVNLEKYVTPVFKKFEYLIGRKKKRLSLEGITEEYLKSKNYPKMDLNTGPYLFESLSFLESIIKEIEPYPGLDIGYRAHEIIESAYQSSRENQIVSFNL
jgi:predicted dehydrogenase